MEYLCTPPQTFLKGRSSYRHDHKFLYIKSGRQCMTSSVDNIHHGNRQSVPGNTAKETIQRNIQGNGCCSCTCNGYCQNRISTQLRFIPCSICFDHCLVYCIDVRCIHATEHLIDCCIDILNSLLHALPQISSLISITQFKRFKFTCRSTTWCCSSSYGSVSQCHFRFNGRISS